MEKTSSLIGVPQCPASKLDIVVDIFKEYAEDENTVKSTPVIYEVKGRIAKDKVRDFYKAMEKVDKE